MSSVLIRPSLCLVQTLVFIISSVFTITDISRSCAQLYAVIESSSRGNPDPPNGIPKACQDSTREGKINLTSARVLGISSMPFHQLYISLSFALVECSPSGADTLMRSPPVLKAQYGQSSCAPTLSVNMVAKVRPSCGHCTVGLFSFN